VLPPHPGALAWLAVLLKPALAGAAFASGGMWLIGADMSAADRSTWFLTVGTGIIVVGTTAITTLGPKLIDLLVQAKVKLAAAEAGTAQALVEQLQADLAALRQDRDDLKVKHAEAVADLVNQRKLNDMQTQTYASLMQAHNVLLATQNKIADKIPAPAAVGADPMKVVIMPESEPVPVREVDGNGGAGSGKGGPA
jgi:urease gamma subunit